MTRARVFWLVAWLAQLACGGAAPGPVSNHADRAPVRQSPIVLVNLCPIIREDGADIDDGGVAVEITTAASRSPRQLARIIGGCREVQLLAHHEIARAECHDPHVDATDVVSVRRPNSHTLVIEVYSIDDRSRTAKPIVWQVMPGEGASRVHLTIGGACIPDPAH